MKKVYVLVFLLASVSSFAQQLEIGGFLGTSNYMGDLNKRYFIAFRESQPAVGLLGRYTFNHQWAARANLLLGRISGDDRNFEAHKDYHPLLRFESPLMEFSITAEWYPFRKLQLKVYDRQGNAAPLRQPIIYDAAGQLLTYQHGYYLTYDSLNNLVAYDRYGNFTIFNTSDEVVQAVFTPQLSPFLFVGFGGVVVNPNVEGFRPTAPELKDNFSTTSITIPIGVGLRYEMNRNWTLGAEGGLRFGFTDYLDGVSESRNPNEDDWYFFGGLTITYNLGLSRQNRRISIDTDADGIIDQFDMCPHEAGLQDFNGCPDSDSDGIPDKDDACPQKAGPAATQGCPDLDKDGIPDTEDDCPESFGLPQWNGCPDTDGDGVLDKDDHCPTEIGTAELNGCPDSDGDGIADKDDACPTKKGPLSTQGCPVQEEVQAEKQVTEISADDIATLQQAEAAIQFAAGNAILQESTFVPLNRVVHVLEKYSNYQLRLIGQGEDAQVAERRAMACFYYLTSKGIASERIRIQTADAAKGEKKQVRFELFLK